MHRAGLVSFFHHFHFVKPPRAILCTGWNKVSWSSVFIETDFWWRISETSLTVLHLSHPIPSHVCHQTTAQRSSLQFLTLCYVTLFCSHHNKIYYRKNGPLPSAGVARFHPSGSFRGGSGSVTSIDKMSRSRTEAILPVWAASTAFAATDCRAIYSSVGDDVGTGVVARVTGEAVVELWYEIKKTIVIVVEHSRKAFDVSEHFHAPHYYSILNFFHQRSLTVFPRTNVPHERHFKLFLRTDDFCYLWKHLGDTNYIWEITRAKTYSFW